MLDGMCKMEINKTFAQVNALAEVDSTTMTACCPTKMDAFGPNATSTITVDIEVRNVLSSQTMD